MVLRHSANAPAMLGLGGPPNGAKLQDVLSVPAVHELRNALARSDDPSRPGLAMGVAVNGRRFDVSAHRFDRHVILEFEPAAADSDSAPLHIVRALISRLVRITDVPRLLKRTTPLLRGLLGYDRVMIYQFADDGSGQVVSEAKREDLESFMGQHFPASDIPQQARALYLRNTIRVIADAAGPRSGVVPELDDTGAPLDLSYAHLRSVSPIHLEYLRNMGVGASMSVSIVVGGELWGLIACHHYRPHPLALSHRIAAEMFGEFFSLHLEALNNRRKLENARRARRALDLLLSHAAQTSDIDGVLRERIADFQALMPCDGVGIWANGRWTSTGAAPPTEHVEDLAQMVIGAAPGAVWATHTLAEALPAAGAYADSVAGVLAVPLSQLPRDYLFFFRRAVVQTVEWGGNPEKTYETGPLGDRLTPRKSFAIWRETVEGQSKPWTTSDREIAGAARGALSEVVLRNSELLADERHKADVRQKMLNEELNHRVKNILALIKSLVTYPSDTATSLAAYVQALQGRVQALSFAHDQIVRGDGGGKLRELIDAELLPHQASATLVQVSGPAVALDARAFSVMALVLHEMATNAVKYGALSRPSGRLSVTWEVDADGSCEIWWRESGGPLVAPPSRRGFGSILVSRSIPYDLGGHAEIDYAAEGVKARFCLPSRYVQKIAEPVQRGPVRTPAVRANALDGLSVLLVEDQLLIAMDAETMLSDLGASRIDTAASVAEALRLLQQTIPDAAILDVNLGDATSQAVADRLNELGVPFIFATGYGDVAVMPSGMDGVPIVRKPYDAASLEAGLGEALARG